ncbi:MAG: hypothetical protein LBC96_02425 [Lachnospiraceae bacterium]|jgi:ABC-type lipoprotein export system ATPase subunit|nr:hypothetical protein [Lachnospiraceae bacterium]
MRVILKNCNIVDYGEIGIVDNYLNIKYAINGTGKSTISQALLCLLEDSLDSLLPFKYYTEKSSGNLLDEHRPSIEVYTDAQTTGTFTQELSPVKSVRVFNEEYVERHTLVGDDVVQNSFEIYVKTQDYDAKMQEINALIQEITDFFSSYEELDDIISRFNVFITKIVKPGKNKPISTTSPLHKALSEGNKTVDVPDELKGYKSYIVSASGGRWAKWQKDGNEYLDWDCDNVNCPYCSLEVNTTQKPIIKKLSESFSSSYLDDLKAVIDAFDSIKEFFVETTIEKIDKLGASSSGFTQNEIDFVKSVCERIDALLRRLQNAKSLGFYTFDTLKNVDDFVPLLNDNVIDLLVYPELKSAKTETIVNSLNESLERIIQKANELRAAVDAQNLLIQETIRKNESGINHFLMKAGYQYTVSIEEDEKTKKYRMLLKYRNGEVNIPEIKKHLSFGEKNAFALALFMYDVVKEKPDLVILDDPISSFDKHKKYAIMDMLFCGDDVTLRGLTTLMLTHDFEPIADVIKTHSRVFTWKPEESRRGQFAKASFLYNEANPVDDTIQLKEKPILDSNVRNYINILKENCKSSSNIISKLIYLRRLREIESDKTGVWDVLSCFFHKDTPVPKTLLGEDVDVSDAEQKISQEINEAFCYSVEYPKFWNGQSMIDIYKSCTQGYEKLQLFRCLSAEFGQVESDMTDLVFAKFVNETYHSEMDYILQLNPREFEIVPLHILQRCDSKVLQFENALRDEVAG